MQGTRMAEAAIAKLIINHLEWVYTAPGVFTSSSVTKIEGIKYPTAIPRLFAFAAIAVA